MSVTLVLTDPLLDRLHQLRHLDVESGGVLLARLVETPTAQIRLLGRDLIEVPDAAYERREADELLIGSEGYVPALAVAEAAGCVPIWFHTHPGAVASPSPSEYDLEVNASLSDVFRLRADSPFYGALIVAGTHQLTFTGLLDDGVSSKAIGRIWQVGGRLRMWHAPDHPASHLEEIYDRSIRAFGGPVQQVLGDLDVAIVGCGGTGSAVAEQLVRLGVRRIRVIDPDELSPSNVTRVYGSTPSDVGKPKVDVAAEHLQRIAPSVDVVPVQGAITDESVAKLLIDSDVVFGCTDDNAGRMVLSRLATYFLTPVIDCGVLLSTDNGHHLDGIHGRITALYPGEGCLICRGRIDLARAGAERLNAEEHRRLAGEGYAPALPGVEPAVVAFTTAVAATAVAELIERLTHYGVEPVPSEVLLRLHDREMSTNNHPPAIGHYCDAEAGKIGLGHTTPFLEQTW